MNKLVIAVALCAALAACNKQDAAPADTAAPATDAAMPADAAATPADAAAMPAVPAAAPSDMAAAPADAAAVPAACDEYFKRAEACYAKAGTAGASMKSAFDTARTQMAAMPADQMEAGCKAANDQFAQTAAALKCE